MKAVAQFDALLADPSLGILDEPPLRDRVRAAEEANQPGIRATPAEGKAPEPGS